MGWIEGDVTKSWRVPVVDVWHDRAVFHFLTEDDERAQYVARAREALRPGGALVIATFGLQGPERCSGLPVVRYSPESLQREMGSAFTLEESVVERHRTPAGLDQEFCYCRFTRSSATG